MKWIEVTYKCADETCFIFSPNYQLHKRGDGRAYVVPLDFIASDRFHFNEFEVKETYEEIKQKIKEAR